MPAPLRRILPYAVVVLAWAFSLWAAGGLGDGQVRWLSGHTLACFQGYDRWGVLPTLGANLVLPYAPETAGADLRALEKHEGAYLTYPSAWTVALWLPYAALRLVLPGLAPGEGYLQASGALLVGLVGALAIFAATRELGRILLRPDAAAWRATAPALAVAIAWLCAPAVLWYSRYSLFADQFTLPACYVAIAIALRARFRLAALTRPLALGLAACGFFAWSTEWLGWVTMAVLMAAFAWRSWAELPGETPEARAGAFARQAGALLWPAALAVGLYAAQLVYFHEALHDLLMTFQRRALSRETDDGQALATGVILGRLLNFGIKNLPTLFQSGMRDLAQALLAGAPARAAMLAPLAGRGIAGAGTLAAWRGAPERRLAALAIAVVLLPPTLHTLLLLQHAAIHGFSMLKLAFPLDLLLFGLPALAVLQRLPAPGAARGVAAALGVAVALVLLDARPAVQAFAPPPNRLVADLQALVATRIGPRELVVSEDFGFDTMHALAHWNVGRLIYHPDMLAGLAPKLRPGALAEADAVVLALAGGPAQARLAPLVAGQWRRLPETVAGRPVVLGRVTRGVLGPWLQENARPYAGRKRR